MEFIAETIIYFVEKVYFIEKVKVNGKFVLINKNSLSQKELKEIDIDVSAYGFV